MIDVSDVLEWVGSKYGDQREYLVCETCKREWPWTENSPRSCPDCDSELYVHVPNSEALVIRWRVWYSDQKWIPQRMYLSDHNGDWWFYWQWLGREWWRRSRTGLFED